MEHSFEEFGPTGFQDLAAALAIAKFGAGVQVMGPGRDGGRDMYYEGQLEWNQSHTWEGYTVFQVKHQAKLSRRPAENASWLWQEIRKELVAWAEPSGNRSRLPDFMVFITNAPLSAVPEVGGHDKIHQNIKGFIENLRDGRRDVQESDKRTRLAKLQRLEHVKEWRIWDGNQLSALLATAPGVRRAFSSFLTAPDVFASLHEVTEKLPLEQLEPALREHARTSLIRDGQIYFDEAGSSESAGFDVHQVAVDLPISIPDSATRSSVIPYILQRAEHMLKPGITYVHGPRHIVLTGAPGNGKTTLSKFLVQAFRSAAVKRSGRAES